MSKQLTVCLNINKNIERVALPYWPINNNNKLGTRYKMDLSHV